MTDYVLRGLSIDKSIRFFAVNAKSTVQTAVDIHHLSTTASVALGRLLIAGLLMATGMKNEEDLLTLRIDGDGLLGTLLVTATENSIKGYVQNPQIELPMNERGFAVAEALGNGSLSVIKSMGSNPPYVGHVQLISGEIGEDLCFYYQQSEQIDTILNLGILIEANANIRQAGGILVQCMPDASVETIKLLKENSNRLPNLSDVMDMGHSIDFILEEFLFKNIPVKLYEKKSVSYSCNCQKSRFYDGIKMLGRDELLELIEEKEVICAECHFCNKSYSFTKEELESML